MDGKSDRAEEAAGLRVSAALRALGHALVTHRAPDAVLDRIACAAEEFTREVAAAPSVVRTVADELAALQGPAPDDGAPMDHAPACPVSGQLNPLGLAMTVRRVGDEAVAEVTLGAASAGSPGKAHGGVVSALLDDIMGFVLSSLQRAPGVTARLEIQFRRPVPIGLPLVVRGRLRSREGRKLHIDASLEREGTVLAEAAALFLVVEPKAAVPAG